MVPIKSQVQLISVHMGQETPIYLINDPPHLLEKYYEQKKNKKYIPEKLNHRD